MIYATETRRVEMVVPRARVRLFECKRDHGFKGYNIFEVWCVLVLVLVVMAA